MEPNDYAAMCLRAVERANEKLGENYTPGEHSESHEMALEIMGMTADEADALIAYMTMGVRLHIFNDLVEGGGSMTPVELMEKTVETVVPTLMMIAKEFFLGDRGNDKYLTTVEAEVSLRNMIVEEKDLSIIWPVEYVDEITKVYTSPSEAFLAGVICGRHDG